MLGLLGLGLGLSNVLSRSYRCLSDKMRDREESAAAAAAAATATDRVGGHCIQFRSRVYDIGHAFAL